jgi:DNA-binding PucR family transcriptional regulator
MRALLPVPGEGADAERRVFDALRALAAEHDLVVGSSDVRRGRHVAPRSLAEAVAAVRIAASLLDRAGVLPYRDTGAYRYLIDLLDGAGPQDHLQEAVQTIIEYDRERRSQLLLTLEEYLGHGRGLAATARSLTIHVNTLRQRLERVEKLTGLALADEDLLALQLAIKLARVRG